MKAACSAILLAALPSTALADRHDDLVAEIQKVCDVTRKAYDKNICQAQVFEAPALVGGGNASGSLGRLTAPASQKRLGAIVQVLGFSPQLGDACNAADRYDADSDTWTLARTDHTGQRKALEDVAELWQLGYDVYSLDWCDPNTLIQRNASVLMEALDIVRGGTFPDNPSWSAAPLGEDEKLIVIGGSMGGLVSRYALSYLENKGEDHGVDLFVSFDAPQEGAYLPIGLQHLAEFLDIGPAVGATVKRLHDKIFENETDPESSLFTTLRELRGAETPAARQMLLVHKDGPLTSGPTEDFEDLFDELDDLGYPNAEGLRTVAIANGSGAAHWTASPLRTVRFTTGDPLNKTYKIKFPKNAEGTLTDPILWQGTLKVRIPATIELIVNPLTRSNSTMTVFEARLNVPGVYINDVFIAINGAIDVGVIRDILDLPDELPAKTILSPFVQTVRDLVDSILDQTVLFKVERRANVPVAYATVPAGTSDKFQKAKSLLKLPSLGGSEVDPFIPTTSALGLNRKRHPADTNVSALLASGAWDSPFDQVYFHDTETPHVEYTDEARMWLCNEVSAISATPHLTSIFPSKRPAGSPAFTLEATGESLHENLVLVWTNTATGDETLLETGFQAGKLFGEVPRELIEELPPCVNGFCNPLFPEFAPMLITVKDVSTGVLACGPLPFSIEEDRVTVDPNPPVAGEPFLLTLSDTWRDGCHPQVADDHSGAYTLSGNRITIATEKPDGSCLFVLTDYEIKTPVEPLAAGNYEVVYTLNGSEELARQPFVVRPGPPAITGLEPAAVEAGPLENVSLTIYGGGFLNQSMAMWNGNVYPTQFVDANTLMTVVPLGDLASPGFLNITVVTPDDLEDLQSAPAALTITEAAPMITNVTPAEIPAGNGDTLIVVNGQGFSANSVVALPSSSDEGLDLLETTFLARTALEATLPALLTATPGALRVLVVRNTLESNSVAIVIRSSEPIVSLLPEIQNVTDAASYRTVLTPLAFASAFGSEFAAVEMLASIVPLRYELGGIEVTVNGIPAAIQYVSPTQINFQVPGGVEIGSIAQVIVIRNGVPGESFELEVKPDAFGFFSYFRALGTPDQSLDPVIVTAENQLVTPDNPAKPNQVLVAYGTGVSSLNNPPADAQASPSDPLSTCAVTPLVTVRTDQASAPVKVLYCGLTANFLSLIQLNVELTNRPPGANPKLFVKFGDADESEGVPLYFVEEVQARKAARE
ncbi:MAG: hypothetical protein WD733_20860 [Bryobacterales bacterium]